MNKLDSNKIVINFDRLKWLFKSISYLPTKVAATKIKVFIFLLC